jgi:hypothetical protein
MPGAMKARDPIALSPLNLPWRGDSCAAALRGAIGVGNTLDRTRCVAAHILVVDDEPELD